MFLKAIQSAAAVAMLASLGACTSVDTEQRLQALEDKVNRALQNSAAAKVDATTALMIAEEK